MSEDLLDTNFLCSTILYCYEKNLIYITFQCGGNEL